jgi:hypothetical protein
MPQINIDNIKTQFKTILDTANTTTASPVDLSDGLARRVQRVMKIHPGRIQVQASFIPFVTIWADSVDLEPLDICKNQVTAQREANFTFKVAVACFEPFPASDNDEDQGSENCEKLIENVEQILRSNQDLNSAVKWQFPDRIEFDETQYSEETNLRAAIMDLNCRIYY